jgi:two-component system, sensor histidine kinase LadS
MKYLVSLLILLLSASRITAAPLLLDLNFQSKSLGSYFDYLTDRDKQITIKKILADAGNDTVPSLRWEKSVKNSFGFGFTSAAYWVRFTIKNNTGSEKEYYLEQKYPLISYLDLYIIEGRTFSVIKTGHNYPFSKRPMEYRNFVFPIILKPHQETTCYLRYRSDSAMNIDLTIYSPQSFQAMREKESIFLWIFYTVLSVMVLYNLFIFFSVRDRGYLFYIITIIFMIFLAMGLNGISYQYLWPDSVWWEHYNIPIFVGITFASFMQFSRYFTSEQIHVPKSDIVNIFTVIVSLCAGFSTLIIQNYHISIILTTAIIVLSMIFNIPVLAYLIIKKKSRTSRSYTYALSVPLLGWLLYTLKTYGIIPENIVTNYSLQAGFAAMVVLLSIGLADRINMMRLQVKDTQKKYLRLLESSNDIIFNLDENLRFNSINMAVKKHLGFDPEEILNTHFLDYLDHPSFNKDYMYQKIYEEYITGLGRNRNEITFRAQFKTKYSHEPMDLSVKMEYIKSEGKVNIFGKASPVTDDIIVQLLDTENHVYYVDNYFSYVELLSQRLTRNLGKHLDPPSIQSIKISLIEIIINAIEHGNLDIQFSEKTKAMIENTYLQFIKDRQMDPRFSGKKVKIEYFLSKSMTAYRITDEGKGFDHRKVLSMSPDDLNKELITHGRGLIITQEAFDMVTFNESGNQVLLIKYFNGPVNEEPRF